MKDLLEVIEEGIRDFGEEVCPEDTHDINGETGYRTKDYLTSHTKAILTNQIERMKKDEKFKGIVTMDDDFLNGKVEGYNLALQTQIDYLEDVIKKI